MADKVKKNNIAQEWQDFSAIMPKDASRIQREEMQKAFYAGFHSALNAVLLLPDDEEKAIQEMDDLLTESTEFFNDLGITAEN